LPGAGFCEGLEPALQILLSTVARMEEMGRLFVSVYMCSLLGGMTGGPIMSSLMSVGRNPDSASRWIAKWGIAARMNKYLVLHIVR